MLVEIAGKKGEERLVTTNRQVAEIFGKYHKDVLESIRNLKNSMDTAKFSALFYESTYVAEYVTRTLS